MANLVEKCQSLELHQKLAHQLDLDKVLTAKLDIGLLVDLIGFSADLDCSQRQSVLELSKVEERLTLLINILTNKKDGDQQQNFPPDFSNN